MIIRQFEINNIQQFVIREIKRDCCKPEVVCFYDVRLGHLVNNI